MDNNYKFNSVELFAGAGGLALGLEKSGFNHILLNEWDKNACKTLKHNRTNWNVIEGDVCNIDFKKYSEEFEKNNTNVDLLTGGFPCQAFSYAGKQLGFEDTRGTMFFEFARAVKELKPKMFLVENVKGLKTHDKGNTLKTIVKVLGDLGYKVLEPTVLNSNNFNVPQKRERIIIIGIRNDLFKQPLTKVRGFLETLS